MIKRKILIVEDEVISSMSLKLLLELWGYETYEASSGKDAIKILRNGKIDLALMDINIKGDRDGIEVAKQIRLRFHTPSIFITGYSDKEMLEKAEMAKPIGIFIKPLNFDRLKLTIDSFFHETRENEKKLIIRKSKKSNM